MSAGLAQPDEALELRSALRALGYDARCVNMSAYDVHQNGYRHYLSAEEALALRGSTGPHPLHLLAHGERRGLNLWYTFPPPAGGA